MSKVRLFILLICLIVSSAVAAPLPTRESVEIKPWGTTGQSLVLGIKRYPRPGMPPLLLVPGLASNDRIWDSTVEEYSFAKALWRAGFDVWVANLRGSGTIGFRSDSPAYPHHWTVEDHAIDELPALVDTIHRKTGFWPFLLGHSLAAWIFEGYLAGLERQLDGGVLANPKLGSSRQRKIPGIVTIAGVYGLWWKKALQAALWDPLVTDYDFYHSNYEIESLVGLELLYEIIPNLPYIPFAWIADALDPGWIRSSPIFQGRKVYERIAREAASTSLLNMLYYTPNIDSEVVRLHGVDGLEDMSPKIIEQLANAFTHHETLSHFHIERPDSAYSYRGVRARLETPILFVAGSRDRLASSEMILWDGYRATRAADKTIFFTEAGHLDIMCGYKARDEVFSEVIRWIRNSYRVK